MSASSRRPADVERSASDFVAHVAARGSLPGFAARHPVVAARGLAAVRRLPVVPITCSTSTEGRVLARVLRGGAGGRIALGGARAALTIPADPADYLTGSSSSKHTLRRKVRRAERAGVTWRRVDDPAERDRIAAIAQAHDRAHPDPRYRNPAARMDDLRGVGLWLAAFDGDRPVLLAAIPVDGPAALLRYFRQLTDDDVASDTRYLMMAALVAALSAAGVRHLLDDASPHLLGDGVRHFQRMVGFRLVRLRLAG